MKFNILNFITNIKLRLTILPTLVSILFLINELKQNACFNTFMQNINLIIIVISFSIIIEFIFLKLIQNSTISALIAATFIFINLFYRDIFQAISHNENVSSIINKITLDNPELIIIPIILTIWIALSIFLLNIKQLYTGIIFYFNLVLILFIIVETIQWLVVPVNKVHISEQQPFQINTNLLPQQKPDIYFIILDSYTSSESLMKYWQYDNSEFESSLSNIGFFIARKSKTNYISTPYCIASYLNSSTLILDSTIRYNERNLEHIIRNNRLYEWLKRNNYECYNYSIFDTFDQEKYYNFLTYNNYLGRTIWFTNYIKLYHLINPSSRIPYTNLKIINEIKNISKQKNKPIFIYAHLMIPHSPFFFDRFGNPNGSKLFLSDKQKYLEQLIYTNSLVLKLVRNILASTISNPFIIVQGDHGFRNLDNYTKIDKYTEARSIFYAIYSPKNLKLTDNFNPKDTFSRIINCINN